MKEYIKPELNVKSLVQNITVAAEELPDGEYGNELLQSVPNSWWPF